MRRIFLPDQAVNEKVVIAGEKAFYISAVLRSVPGDTLIIHDNKGNVYKASILSSSRKEVVAAVSGRLPSIAESPVRLRLYQGLLKGEKMDMVIQKSAELGVSEIVPVVTERSQVRETRKLPRWRKIAEEAARQSGRPVIPSVGDVTGFDSVCLPGTTDATRGILFWEAGGEGLQGLLSGLRGVRQLDLITGPEGGLSESEVLRASESGFAVASLGSRILRAETAAIVAVSLVQYETGGLGSG